jgi:hypothetical protein
LTATFSDYVRSLGPDGEPPDLESFEALLDRLRGALVYEMKKRGLWHAPPSYLGVYGGASWSDGDLLEDLALDCYFFVFVRRLAALQRQMVLRPNVDGLVFLNVRHFLHETQKRHDPLGFRVFEVVSDAVKRLLGDARLHVLEGEAKLRGSTVLGFATWSDPRQAEDVDLRLRVAAWCDELLPELITAWSRDEVTEQLAGRISELAADGVEAFRFQDLVEPLKSTVRARWQMAGRVEQGETAFEDDDGVSTLVCAIRPDAGFEERAAFDTLLDCTAGRIDSTGGNRKSRDYLHRLWFFLRGWAAEPTDDIDDAADPDDDIDSADDTNDRLPSDKRLAEILAIPRARIRDLKAKLGKFVETCRKSATLDISPVIDNRGPATPISPSAALAMRRQALRRATGEEAARSARQLTEALARGEGVRPGELFLHRSTRDWPILWAIVDLERHGELARMVPVDAHPLVGSDDVPLPDEASALRGGESVLVRTDAFDPDLRVGLLPASALAEVRRRQGEFTVGARQVSWRQREAESDPEYRAWRAMLSEAAAALPTNVLPFHPRRRTTPSRRFHVIRTLSSIAAILAVTTIGLFLKVGELRRQTGEPAPSADVVGYSTMPEIVFGEQTRGMTLRVEEGETQVSFSLVLVGTPPYPAYRLRLVDAGGVEVWSTDLERDPLDEYLLTLSRGLLRRGMYTLVLDGRDGVLEEEIGVEEIRVE